MTYSFTQTLPNCNLDIIGDVHGELDALFMLLTHLGYNQLGEHPEQRYLVFVGDLCDRGHNSPGVLRQVQQLVERGKASVILGNHEINLLINDAKDGSGWFFPQRETSDNRFYAPYQKALDTEKSSIIDFLKQQPLILIRDDLRIVHACWDNAAIQKLEQSCYADVIHAYAHWETETTRFAANSGLKKQYDQALHQWESALENPQQQPPFLDAIAQYEILESQENPIKVLTSGTEQLAEAPFFIGNKWRFTDRSRWWDHYSDDIPVVIGHYWRNFFHQSKASRYSQLFNNVASQEWHGLKKNVFCVDFSIGANWRARHPDINAPADFFHLAALRWPENQLVLHTGQLIDLDC